MPLSRLILFRHGEAEQRSPSGQDIDRPLTDGGRAEARAAGRRLAEAGIVPELALVSNATRAAQTWEEAALALPQTRVAPRPDLYQAGPEELMSAAEGAGAASVVLVGHNPSMHGLAMGLLAHGAATPAATRRLAAGFPTGAVAVFRFDDGVPFGELALFPHDGDGR